ncbi:uncharacterized protein DUF4136 [Algoriphagus boseongensis]|uniref:Uncharacterized protein DUF4136 n=1 Tax=Algoriphagus boseongensis TaxID=1442587 RepID=A0A4R6T980_9BACT|nr:DUF4136 domain-containing protein [Algoriphagus boseongensis]TDQ18402.1 uncharacterized protein DUF4136 [Algoriphagus boseongensis]
MKTILAVLLTIFALCSCKVSDSVTADQRTKYSEKLTVDQITKSSDLADKKTFKVIETKDVTKNTAQVNRIFEKKLIENGFAPVDENPELLIQSVITSVDFEKEVLGFSSTVGLTDSNSYSPPRTEYGQYGKVIFLIQDAKTNEVLWMGTGTGLLTANEVLNSKEIKFALNQLIAGLK